MAKAHQTYSSIYVFASLVAAVTYATSTFLCESGSIFSLEGHGADDQSQRRLNKKQVATREGGHQQEHHHHIPNFLLAGAQKAGTTAVADYMLRRKDVCGPKARIGLSFTAKEIPTSLMRMTNWPGD